MTRHAIRAFLMARTRPKTFWTTTASPTGPLLFASKFALRTIEPQSTSGIGPQAEGSVNAVYSITASVVFYVFRTLVRLSIPSNAGGMRPLEIIAPEGTIVNALPPAAVCGGNVETSQRIADVLYKCWRRRYRVESPPPAKVR